MHSAPDFALARKPTVRLPADFQWARFRPARCWRAAPLQGLCCAPWRHPRLGEKSRGWPRDFGSAAWATRPASPGLEAESRRRFGAGVLRRQAVSQAPHLRLDNFEGTIGSQAPHLRLDYLEGTIVSHTLHLHLDDFDGTVVRLAKLRFPLQHSEPAEHHDHDESQPYPRCPPYPACRPFDHRLVKLVAGLGLYWRRIVQSQERWNGDRLRSARWSYWCGRLVEIQKARAVAALFRGAIDFQSQPLAHIVGGDRRCGFGCSSRRFYGRTGSVIPWRGRFGP